MTLAYECREAEGLMALAYECREVPRSSKVVPSVGFSFAMKQSRRRCDSAAAAKIGSDCERLSVWLTRAHTVGAYLPADRYLGGHCMYQPYGAAQIPTRIGRTDAGRGGLELWRYSATLGLATRVAASRRWIPDSRLLTRVYELCQ